MIKTSYLLQMSLSTILIALLLSACSTSPEDQGGKSGWGNVSIFSLQAPSTKAPKYMEPTMDNLMGKPQPFPSEYPVVQYPNSKVILAQVRPVYTERKPNMVVLSSRDNIPQVASYYKQRLVAEGWKFQSAFENSAYSSTIWLKENQQAEVRVSPAPQEGEQIIQVLISPAPQGAKK